MKNKLTLPLDWELNKIDEAKTILDDIQLCREAEYRIQWADDALASDNSKVPVLVMIFSSATSSTTCLPALGIRLATHPANTLIEGDKLKRHLRNSVEHFLVKNGLWLPFEEKFIKV